MEFCLGGIAGCCAGFFTNPLEVVKTRMQLQGELKARGQYTVHYRNVFHAFYNIAKVDGILSLQKGLVPALWYQLVMNGVRLGTFQYLCNSGFTKDENGNLSVPRNVAAGAFSGTVGAFVSSPMYLVKTHLQALSSSKIAVGFQHSHAGMIPAIRTIFRDQGIRGLFRGVTGAVPRVTVGSSVQLSTFSTSRDYVERLQIFHKGSLFNALGASMLSGVVVVMFMTPFDVVSTRLYNQGTTPSGKGLYYSGVVDCFVKIFRKEGVWGFYKGWAASLFRLGPHTIISLVFWDQLRVGYFKFKSKYSITE